MSTMREDFEAVISSLVLDARRKDFLRARWLEHLIRLDAMAERSRRRHYRLRLTTVIGAALLPWLVSVRPSLTLRSLTRFVSVLVASAVALEELFHYGAKWEHHRRLAEALKAEGWMFFELAGPYAADNATHETAYPLFEGRVTELVQSDVGAYITKLSRTC
jgi:uncharacterized protein DUF4231